MSDFVIFDETVSKTKKSEPVPVLYVPDDFEPKKYLAANRQGLSDRARYFLHLLHTQSIFNNRKGGVNLKAKYLRDFMTKEHYAAIINDLEEGGVVNVKRNYQQGRHSYEYSLTDTFRSKIFRRFEPTDFWLIRKLRSWRSKEEKSLICPTRKHLRENLLRVRVEFEEASRMLSSLSLNDNSFADCLNSLIRLNDRDWYFTADIYGRVHHNVSCLKRELRQFIRIDGESLVELDISNSQPLFCGLTYFIWSKHGGSFAQIHSNDSLSSVLSLKEENLELLLSQRSSVNTIQEEGKNIERDIPLRCLLDTDLNSKDKNALEYLLLCEKGGLYEYLAERANEDISDNGKRNDFKKKVFSSVMFAKRKHMSNALAKVFQKEFPSVYEMIMDAKEKDNSRLAGWMQRVESDLVIDRVVKKFAEDRADAFILTIHDSVLTKNEDAEFVKGLLQTEFRRLGVSPKLNSK